jgi:alanyl-tRNA synthetase
METRKLFYEDCHQYDFAARVVECTQIQGGFAVTLDSTAFYPEGGGQACDLGILGGVNVLDVREHGDDIIHLCDAPLTPGADVQGSIDHQRRFDLMQQHTGEHIVSGIICRRYGWHNVGFHIGAEGITIDFDGPIPAEDLPEIEAEANRAVWQNLPIRCWVPSPEELPAVQYRSKKALSWPVRIVEVPGVDCCACCGVHVERTGEVGIIKLFSCVKFHQGVRIEMACGGRALSILNSAYDQNRQVSQAFSAKIHETGAAARRMNERLAEVEFHASALERKIWDATAAKYADKGNVVHMDAELSPSAVRELADRIARCCGGTAAVLGGRENISICFMGPADAVRTLGNAVKAELNARGGGKPGIFQGTIFANEEQIMNFFRDWYREETEV